MSEQTEISQTPNNTPVISKVGRPKSETIKELRESQQNMINDIAKEFGKLTKKQKRTLLSQLINAI